MDSHNTKPDAVVTEKLSRRAPDKEDAQVVTSNLFEAHELSISEDDDIGSDPYNSTGTHVIIPPKDDDV